MQQKSYKMTKYITVKLTEDQHGALINSLYTLLEYEIDDSQKAFYKRLITALAKAKS